MPTAFQLHEDFKEWLAAVGRPAFRDGQSGTIACHCCQAEADWQRRERSWSVKCSSCGWSAFGAGDDLAPAH